MILVVSHYDSRAKGPCRVHGAAGEIDLQGDNDIWMSLREMPGTEKRIDEAGG